jgi:hypothetical protein
MILGEFLFVVEVLITSKLLIITTGVSLYMDTVHTSGGRNEVARLRVVLLNEHNRHGLFCPFVLLLGGEP